MLGRGWTLSPDTGGVTFATGRDPHLVPAEAYLRRGPGPHRMMIGGRYLSGAGEAAVTVDVDGRPVARWVVTPAQPSFLQWIDLDAGVLAPDTPGYATVHVRVEALGGARAAPRIGLEQFDFAADDVVMAGFGDGWQEPEVEVDTGRTWRWAGPHATLMVCASGPARLTLAGESPGRYFERPSTFIVAVDGREVSRFTAEADFTQVIDLPAHLFTSIPARLTIDSDQSFVPAERGDSPDRRELAQRFFRVEVTAP